MQDELQAILENPCVLTILNNMTEYVYIVDEQGCLQFINPAVEAFENLTNSEVKGKHIKELYTQGESPTLKALYEQKTIPEHENIYMLDGKQYHQLAKSFPLFAGDKLLGVCTVQRDMTLVSQVLSDNTALQKNQQKNPKAKKKTFDSLIGEHPAFQRSIELAKSSAVNDVPILLSGFTGSGKEVFAQAIHNSSPRKNKPFLAINCAAVPDGLLEGILFGTTKGSYTGAENRKGLFEEADGGIFFLDEINSLPYHVQGKLLRVVQEGTFRPIGSNQEKRVNVKIIAAMNIDPMEAIEKNILRKDLFYRLSGNMIYLPPLRERPEDIEYFIDNYIDLFNEVYNKQVKGISEELRLVFLRYDWEGNVRELKHVIESMVSMTKNEILQCSELPLYLHTKFNHEDKKGDVYKLEHMGEDSLRIDLNDCDCNLRNAVEELEKEMIIRVLSRTKGNKTKAGQILGIPRQTLKYKMGKLGIEDIEKN